MKICRELKVYSLDQINSAMREIDTNNDGRISFDEFLGVSIKAFILVKVNPYSLGLRLVRFDVLIYDLAYV